MKRGTKICYNNFFESSYFAFILKKNLVHYHNYNPRYVLVLMKNENLKNEVAPIRNI